MPGYRLFWGPDMGSVAPHAVLEELGLPYELVQVNFGAGEHKNPIPEGASSYERNRGGE